MSSIAAVLADMGDEQLADFIARHLGPDEPDEIWDALTQPGVTERSRSVLTSLMSDVNNQLATEAARMDALPRLEPEEYRRIRREHSARRARMLGFKRLAERRLRQVKDAEAASRRQKLPDQAGRAKQVQTDHAALMERHARAHRDAVRLLALAINTHRQAVITAGITPEKTDLDLWAVLDDVSVPYQGGSATVAEMLTEGPWCDAPVATHSRRRGVVA